MSNTNFLYTYNNKKTCIVVNVCQFGEFTGWNNKLVLSSGVEVSASFTGYGGGEVKLIILNRYVDMVLSAENGNRDKREKIQDAELFFTPLCFYRIFDN